MNNSSGRGNNTNGGGAGATHVALPMNLIPVGEELANCSRRRGQRVVQWEELQEALASAYDYLHYPHWEHHFTLFVSIKRLHDKALRKGVVLSIVREVDGEEQHDTGISSEAEDKEHPGRSAAGGGEPSSCPSTPGSLSGPTDRRPSDTSEKSAAGRRAGGGSNGGSWTNATYYGNAESYLIYYKTNDPISGEPLIEELRPEDENIVRLTIHTRPKGRRVLDLLRAINAGKDDIVRVVEVDQEDHPLTTKWKILSVDAHSVNYKVLPESVDGYQRLRQALSLLIKTWEKPENISKSVLEVLQMKGEFRRLEGRINGTEQSRLRQYVRARYRQRELAQFGQLEEEGAVLTATQRLARKELVRLESKESEHIKMFLSTTFTADGNTMVSSMTFVAVGTFSIGGYIFFAIVHFLALGLNVASLVLLVMAPTLDSSSSTTASTGSGSGTAVGETANQNIDDTAVLEELYLGNPNAGGGGVYLQILFSCLLGVISAGVNFATLLLVNNTGEAGVKALSKLMDVGSKSAVASSGAHISNVMLSMGNINVISDATQTADHRLLTALWAVLTATFFMQLLSTVGHAGLMRAIGGKRVLEADIASAFEKSTGVSVGGGGAAPNSSTSTGAAAGQARSFGGRVR